VKEDKIIEPFFSHDKSASQDRKILKMMITFRKLAKNMSKDDLESFVSLGAYGIFWRIVEFMHSNDFPTEDLEVVADSIGIEPNYLYTILNDFELFRIDENLCYVSDRILRNLHYVEVKNEDKKEAANVRWLLATFNKYYEEYFGKKPILSNDEIEILKEYNKKIEDFKKKLPDILYTLKNLKFDNDIKFKPCSNWLLKNNNLGRLVNGEFGELQHKKTDKEIRQEQIAAEAEKEKSKAEFDSKLNQFCDRDSALVFLSKNTILLGGGKVKVAPPYKPLMDKFNISNEDVMEYKKCQK